MTIESHVNERKHGIKMKQQIAGQKRSDLKIE